MGRHAGQRARSQGFRASDVVWVEFLQHLKTLSAIEVSKLPGMPSAPAFGKKRLRDPDFDAQASEIMANRRLNNSGRKRITSDQVNAFIQAIATCRPSRVLAMEGMPSEAWIYKRRLRDGDFRQRLEEARVQRAAVARAEMTARLEERQLKVAYRERRRAESASHRAVRIERQAVARRAKAARATEDFRLRLHQDELYAAVARCVPSHIRQDAREDIIANVVLAMLEGEVPAEGVAAVVREATRQHWRMFGDFNTVSIDAPLRPGSKLTIGDTLVAA